MTTYLGATLLIVGLLVLLAREVHLRREQRQAMARSRLRDTARATSPETGRR